MLVKVATGNKLQWNLNQNWYIYIQENVFENIVWKMATIVSLPQSVKADTWSAMDPQNKEQWLLCQFYFPY